MSNTNWKTPPDLFDMINKAVGGFKVDAAADTHNHLLDRWYGPGSDLAEDALDPKLDWLSPVWCNPPYGKAKDWDRWLAKFQQQGERGVGVVTLIPASIETQWWHRWIAAGLETGQCDVIFLIGRVNFLKPCSHCERTGQCDDDLPGLAGEVCCGGVCEVCGGSGHVEMGSPRFPSALIFYGPTARGKIGWLNWRSRVQEKMDREQDPHSRGDGD